LISESAREYGAQKALKLSFIQAPSLGHGLFVGVLDDDDGGPGCLFFVCRVSGEEAEEGPEAGRPSGVVLEFQVDVPESAFMADGGQVVPG
jgi:hypothetical protein